jgi:hypothetical protein
LKTSIIWNVSENRPFPLDLWKHPKIKLQVNQVSSSEISKIKFSENEFNFIFLQTTGGEWEKLRPVFKAELESNRNLSLIIIHSADSSEKIYEDVKALSKYLVLENPLHMRELRIILDRSIQAEFYKSAVHDIGSSCLANVGFFEGVFALAHKEYEDSKKENAALKSILDYEDQVKKSQAGINHAIDRVTDLKNQEMIELHERVKASEQLDELREKELKQAFELQKATEEVLNYSRIEELKMEKILKAHEKIFDYSDKEIKDLIAENESLKKKLGMA